MCNAGASGADFTVKLKARRWHETKMHKAGLAMKTGKAVLVGLTIAVLALAAFARQRSGMRGQGRGMLAAGANRGPLPARPAPPFMAALDTNGDGVLEAQEIANAPAALIKLDTNLDGVITADEFYVLPPGRGDARNPPPGIGEISADFFRNLCYAPPRASKRFPIKHTPNGWVFRDNRNQKGC